MKSTGTRFSDELSSLDLIKGYQGSCSSNDRRSHMPLFCNYSRSGIMSETLEQKFRYFDIFVSSCTWSCHFDKFLCIQWRKFHQDDGTSVSVSVKPGDAVSNAESNISLYIIVISGSPVYTQGSFCVRAQPMGDGVTVWRHLSLAGRIHRLIPVCVLCLQCESPFTRMYAKCFNVIYIANFSSLPSCVGQTIVEKIKSLNIWSRI